MTNEELKQYREEYAKYLKECKIGKEDPHGNIITRIFAGSDDFIVYEIKTDEIIESIKVLVFPKNPDQKESEENFTKILRKFNTVKSILFKVKNDVEFKINIASAVAIGIRGDTDGSLEYLNKIEKDINDMYDARFKNKVYFLLCCLPIVSILSLLSVFIYLNAHNFGSFFSNKSLFPILIYVATFGSIGGFLSVALKFKNIEFEKAIPWYMIISYGFQRAIISVLFSIILYFLIKSEFFIGAMLKPKPSVYTILIYSFISGFSETFIPDAISKIERDTKVGT